MALPPQPEEGDKTNIKELMSRMAQKETNPDVARQALEEFYHTRQKDLTEICVSVCRSFDHIISAWDLTSKVMLQIYEGAATFDPVQFRLDNQKYVDFSDEEIYSFWITRIATNAFLATQRGRIGIEAKGYNIDQVADDRIGLERRGIPITASKLYLDIMALSPKHRDAAMSYLCNYPHRAMSIELAKLCKAHNTNDVALRKARKSILIGLVLQVLRRSEHEPLLNVLERYGISYGDYLVNPEGAFKFVAGKIVKEMMNEGKRKPKKNEAKEYDRTKSIHIIYVRKKTNPK